MLAPDLDSIRKPSRPHQWTYRNGVRLEGLMQRLGDEFFETVHAVGIAMGGAVPPPGKIKDEWPSVIMVLQPPPVVLLTPRTVIPVFSTRERAQRFLSVMQPPPDPGVVPFEVYRTVDNVFDLGDAKRFASTTVGKLAVIVDPGYDPARGLTSAPEAVMQFDPHTAEVVDRIILTPTTPDLVTLFILRKPD
jgi:hypothetical protein